MNTRPWFPLAVFLGTTTLATHEAAAFGLYNATGLAGGSRWDATPRTMGGLERSLAGGLRFSLQGGSFAAYRDLFSWSGGVPTVAAFTAAVTNAFGNWTTVDPVSGLGTSISFIADLTTPVSSAVVSSVRQGAEIDLFGATSAGSWGVGSTGTQGETFFNSISVAGNLTLTSGTTGYTGFAISGADVTLNDNPGALYTLDTFRNLLTHELGHALGLADVDVQSGPAGTYIDDNYNASTSATALATLTNSFAGLINPLNPSASPLSLYTVANGDPGVDTPGVDIRMESAIPSVLFFGTGVPLRNDDYAGRQFMYPVVPEPTTAAALLAGAGALGLRRHRKSRVA